MNNLAGKVRPPSLSRPWAQPRYRKAKETKPRGMDNEESERAIVLSSVGNLVAGTHGREGLVEEKNCCEER